MISFKSKFDLLRVLKNRVLARDRKAQYDVDKKGRRIYLPVSVNPLPSAVTLTGVLMGILLGEMSITLTWLPYTLNGSGTVNTLLS